MQFKSGRRHALQLTVQVRATACITTHIPPPACCHACTPTHHNLAHRHIAIAKQPGKDSTQRAANGRGLTNNRLCGKGARTAQLRTPVVRRPQLRIETRKFKGPQARASSADQISRAQTRRSRPSQRRCWRSQSTGCRAGMGQGAQPRGQRAGTMCCTRIAT
jgi:hypothetical protein